MSTHINEINELEEYVNASFPVKKVRVRGFVPEDHHSFPEFVSIGPHFSHLSLPIDDNVKIQLASSLIWSTDGPVSFDSYKSAIEEILDEAMRFYQDDMRSCRSRSSFRSMFLLDGCFIVYLIEALAKGDESGGRYFGVISAKKCCRDLCLLSNQIPFVVVHKLLSVRLYGSDINPPDVMIKVHQHFATFCKYIVCGYRVRNSLGIDLPNSNFGAACPTHLLDLVRMYMGSNTLALGSSTLGLAVPESVLIKNNIYSAYMLRENLGISFEAGSVLEFIGGHFKLPKVIISEHSETLFENLISCEDAVDKNGVICTFMWLMGVLARDGRSVGILKDKHIIVSEFEDTKIVDIFKRMSGRLLPQRLYLDDILHGIGVYKKSRYMTLRRCAFQMRDLFFGNIRRGFATGSALLGIFTTLVIFTTIVPLLNGLSKKIYHLTPQSGWSGI